MILWRIFCFFFGHCWSDWLMGRRRCWACGKVQTFDEFLRDFEREDERK